MLAYAKKNKSYLHANIRTSESFAAALHLHSAHASAIL